MSRSKFPEYEVGVGVPGKTDKDHSHNIVTEPFWTAAQAKTAAQDFLGKAPVVAVLRRGFPIIAWDFAGKLTFERR